MALHEKSSDSNSGRALKLAILIPVYNSAATVAETIGSLQQIERGWNHVEQVVVCDDASTDQSVAVIEQTPFNRCSLKLVRHQINKGESHAYSTMIEELSSEVEWFLILHADDLALPNFIERNLEILSQCDDKVASVASNYWVFDDVGEKLAAEEKDLVIFRAGTAENAHLTATVGSWWHISGALVNRAKWVEFGGRHPSLPYLGDWDLCMRWQLSGYTIGTSAIATTRYRQFARASLSSSAYRDCRDFRDRTNVALHLPEIFHGKTVVTLGFRILAAAMRRSAAFVVRGRPGLALNACRVGIGSFWKLISAA